MQRTRSKHRTFAKNTTAKWPWPISICKSSRAKCLASSVPTAQARPPRSKCCSAWLRRRKAKRSCSANRPAIVFPEEPTSGRDPVGRILVPDIIRELRTEGTTVFLNSHLLSEVEVTCDRVVFIKHGVVIKTVALKDIGQGAAPVEIRTGPLSSTDRSELLNGLNQFGHDARAAGDHLQLIVEDRQKLPEL